MATTTKIQEQEGSSSVTRRSYDVFLSFRGPDTGYNFTDHLYRELVWEGLRVFKDDDEIERGKAIDADSELEMAMRESKISVIVFSMNYAYSPWCVDQLVRIMARHSSGHHVLPVFYHVDPSDVRKQRGSFEAAFVQHQERCKADRVDGWRKALKQVADLGGMNLNKGYESPFIQQIVQVVKSRVRSKCLDLTHFFVGRENDIRSINSWLRDGLDGVGVATISGMIGMGKTTIAKIIYNTNLDKFQGSCFLANVRETSKQPNGLVNLQRKLLSDILKQKANKIHSVDQGQMQIKDALRCQRVLLVLDDVNHMDQIDNIIGTKACFHPGSNLIVTTRHEHLLRGDQVNKIFKITELDFNESLQLFCWYAFGHEHPKHGYEKYSENVVHHCSGLPLALKVLGSSLYGKAMDVWESKLQKLETIPDGDVTGKLKISYDSLKDDLDKRLFLDIACFFVGVDLNIAFKVLDGCNLYPREGIGNLMDRFLVTTSAENKLMMHQLIRDMGREFVRRESPNDPGNYSRLWDDSDAILVLRENKGSESIRGLRLSMLMDDKNETSSNSSTNSTKRLRNEDYTGNLMTPNQRNSPKRRRLGFFSWKPAENSPVNTFSTEALAKMQKLKLLVLYNVKFTGRYKDFPRSLVWLRWHGCSLSSIPEDCSLEKLVVLEMWNSKLKYVWKGYRLFEQLKILDLRHSHDLVRTPDFTELSSLESLVLKGCIRLVQVDESIGYLTRLVSLNLKGCRSLKKLPVENNMLKSLKELNVSGCLQLEDLPQILMKKFESLSVLKANRTIIGNAREVSLSWWQSALSLWQLPRRQPQATGFSLECLPSSLVTLALADSGLADDVVPKYLNCFPSLKNLDLSRNPITRLPESIKNLTMLECLSLCYCTKLQSVPQLPTSIFLDVAGCTSLERIGNYPDSVKCPIFRLT